MLITSIAAGLGLAKAAPALAAGLGPLVSIGGDVAAVIANEGREWATIVGHDWGGATAWAFAQANPALTERLVIVNVPHPAAMSTEMKRPDSRQEGAFAIQEDEESLDSEAGCCG